MDNKNTLLILILVIIAYYLNLSWLVLLLSVVLFLIALSSLSFSKKKEKTVKKVNKNPDVIYPVIYEDVGEPPMLYPEKMAIKIHPETKMYSKAWEDALTGAGNAGKALLKLLFGKKE